MESVVVHQTVGDNASRKCWIIGLSIVAAFLAYAAASDSIKHYKRFNKADRLATGHVVESDPGSPGHRGPNGEAGDPAWSHYQFKLGERLYDGWTDYELAEGETIRVRYNSSNPNFSHAEDDNSGFGKAFFNSGFLLFIVLVVLVSILRDKNRALVP